VTSPDEVLRVLDAAAESYVLPMLDNGYVYLAASRMSLFWSPADWAIVFEIFGYSPRAGLPDLTVFTFGSRLHERDPREKYASEAAYQNYLTQHPHDDARLFFPVAEGDWQNKALDEHVAADASTLVLRDQSIHMPRAEVYSDLGITLSAPPDVCVFELCRYLASKHRDLVLATRAERRVSVPPELEQILVLEDWNHPDLAGSARPSENGCFLQLASVLATGDRSRYRPSEAPNTHWRNWPDGGTL